MGPRRGPHASLLVAELALGALRAEHRQVVVNVEVRPPFVVGVLVWERDAAAPPRPLSVRKLASRRLLPYSRETAGARVFFARRDLDQAMQALRHPARGER
jgi:hypothetical protein